MSQSTIPLRQRLNSLHSITEQLKNTSSTSPLNLNHLKELLSATRQFYNPSLVQSNKAISQSNQIQFTPLFNDLPAGVGQDKKSQQLQMIQLRQQNLRLSDRIKEMKQQMDKLSKQYDTLQEQTAKNPLPYFKITQNLQAFICRLQINANDNNKIDYSAYEVELKLDRIILFRKEKSSFQQFDLTTLRDVNYSDSVIMLRFQQFIEENHHLTSIFLRFHSLEHLHKWDLSIFTNFHIVNSLNEPRLFQTHFRRIKKQCEAQKQKQQIQNLRQSQDFDDKKQKDLLKLLIKRREEYLQVKKLIGQKLQHKIKQSGIEMSYTGSEHLKEQSQIKEKDNQNTKEINQPKNKAQREIVREKQIEKEREEESKPSDKLQIGSKQSNNIFHSEIQRIDQLEEQSQHPQQQNSIHNQHIKHTDSALQDDFSTSRLTSMLPPILPLTFNTSPLRSQVPQSIPPSSAHQQFQTSQRQSKVSIVNQLNNIDPRNRSFESQSRNNSPSRLRQFSLKKVRQARLNLQNGYYATKYSKDGFNPHDKKVFLSLDCKKLCWSERDKTSEYKSIPIAVIIKVQYSILGQGIVKHVKDPDPKYFCVIQYFTSDYKKKTIELGSGNIDEMKSLSRQLQLTVKQNKKNGVPS